MTITMQEASTVDPLVNPEDESSESPGTAKNFSNELFRMTLPLIAEYGGSFAPSSYAVWYEYVRGENSELREELGVLIENASSIDESQTLDIYRRHILGTIETAIRNGQAEFLETLQSIDDSVENARTAASSFDSRLDEFSNSLQGQVNPSELCDSVSSFHGNLKEVSGAIGSLNKKLDVSRDEVKRLANELAKVREEARIDPLSGLLNRRGFDIVLQDAISNFNEQPTDTGKPLIFVLFDIDHFKAVNDTHGHLIGDKVIQIVARTLNKGVMRKDHVARLGGEEFGLLLPQTDAVGAMIVAERVREAIKDLRISLKKSKSTFNVSISGGVSIYRADESPEEFVDRADKALYQAKSSGRDKICQEV